MGWSHRRVRARGSGAGALTSTDQFRIATRLVSVSLGVKARKPCRHDPSPPSHPRPFLLYLRGTGCLS